MRKSHTSPIQVGAHSINIAGQSEPFSIVQGAKAQQVDNVGNHNSFNWAILPRHGRRPIYVRMQNMLNAHNKSGVHDAWSEVQIAIVSDGRYAVLLCHRPPPAYGVVWQDAFICDSVRDVQNRLAGHNAAAALPPAMFAFPPDRITFPLEQLCVQRFLLGWTALLRAAFGIDAHREPGAWPQ